MPDQTDQAPSVLASNTVAASRIVVSLPHAGRLVPAELAMRLRRQPADLWSDWYTGELYGFLARREVQVVTTTYSPFVANPNRDPDGPRHGSFWTSLVPAEDPAGDPLYDEPLTDTEIAHRFDIAHAPYHRALRECLERAVARHGRALLLDLHSFGLELPADVIVGDGWGTTAGQAISDLVEGTLRGAGLRTVRNERFSGGWIVKQFAGDSRVDALQLELNQRCYLDADDVAANRPRPLRDPVRWQETADRLAAVFDQLVATDYDDAPTERG